MDEQIKFEMNSDEVLGTLKDFGKSENDLGKELWRSGFKEQAIEYFKHEASIEIAIKAIEKQMPKKPIKIKMTTRGGVYKCESCGYLIACIPSATKYCDQCGQRLDWEEA